MEIVYFTLAGIILYLASDRLLDAIERAMGRRLQYRSLVFFAILTVLALGSFWLIRYLTQTS